MKSRSTRTLILSALGAVAVAGCGSAGPSEHPAASPGAAVDVPTLTVHLTPGQETFEAVGTVKARLNATLSSKVMARVASVLAREGDSVGKGQTLALLDPRELAAGVQVARANLSASTVGVANAVTASQMEDKASVARIAQADATVQQSRAALSTAQSKLDLALAGPRAQEKTQAHLAVLQAESTLRLAKTQLDRVSGLVAAGAMPKRSLDEAQNGYDLALAQRDTAIQSERIAQEGTRAQDLKVAQEAVAQAKAAVRAAEANLAQARASALQTRVRSEEIRAAKAQVSQSSAALQSAEVSLGYASIQAPFDGRIVRRSADPGDMATPGSPIIALEGGELRLEAAVPEGVLPHIRMGQQLQVRIDALGVETAGTVSEIVPQGDRASHTFLIRVELPKDSVARSGMFGRVEIPTGVTHRIVVPEASVWQREGLTYVYVVNREQTARLRIVTVGDRRGGQVTVLSGLAEGDRIVVGDREKVADGLRVASR